MTDPAVTSTHVSHRSRIKIVIDRDCELDDLPDLDRFPFLGRTPDTGRQSNLGSSRSNIAGSWEFCELTGPEITLISTVVSTYI